jgi:hypothetical protein
MILVFQILDGDSVQISCEAMGANVVHNRTTKRRNTRSEKRNSSRSPTSQYASDTLQCANTPL